MGVTYDGVPQIYCEQSSVLLPKGTTARFWNGHYFACEFNQASWMLRKKKARTVIANSHKPCHYGHVIRPASRYIDYKGHPFCDFEELAKWLREAGIGMDVVIGEDVRAL